MSSRYKFYYRYGMMQSFPQTTSGGCCTLPALIYYKIELFLPSHGGEKCMAKIDLLLSLNEFPDY